MFASHMYLWPLATTAGGTLIVSGLRYLTLFIGLKLTLKEAPKADRLPIYREFARALSLRGHQYRRSLRATRNEPPGWHGPGS
jgi:hypothetical protein